MGNTDRENEIRHRVHRHWANQLEPERLSEIIQPHFEKLPAAEKLRLRDEMRDAES